MIEWAKCFCRAVTGMRRQTAADAAFHDGQGTRVAADGARGRSVGCDALRRFSMIESSCPHPSLRDGWGTRVPTKPT